MTCSGGVLTHGCKFLLTRPSRNVTMSCIVKDGGEQFLLTRPSRDVTIGRKRYEKVITISTHTPLAGRDLWIK